ncbi:TVP38/TMEM64 family protein [Bacillus velezensis]|uniref:TVP38/TMEM64 family protein n=1 Tax=Bacillus velezensis TaxID=492670 RepID=UPI00218BB9C0|nr:TVP38/TMEM64 family protein [Bacillus velezensis]
MRNKKAVTWAAAAAAAGAGLLLWANRKYLNLSPKEIRLWVLSFGVFAPLVFIGISIVRPFVLFPVSIVSVAGGLAFGPFFGTMYTLAGSMGAAAASFFAAGLFAFNEKSRHGKMEAIQKQMKTNGFFYIFILRILPVNFDVISYAAGLSKVRPMTYFLATAAGIIPGTIVLNVLGASFMSGNVLTVLGVICLYIVFLSLPVIFKKKVRHLFGGES